MNDKIVKNDKKMLEYARSLRREMTRHEKHLWYDSLRDYPIKIYKQRVIDNFIADFYCHSARLVIELDGSQHYELEGKMYDQERTDILNRYGIYVLRFSNKEIDEKFEGVCYIIDKTIKGRIKELKG